MSISFIVPCYNCEATLEEAVDSIYDNNYLAGDEVILVNDGSTDNTPLLIEKLTIKYPGIVSFTHSINKGSAAAARNTAIDHCSHELLFCLDSDNILIPGTIGPLREFLLENKLDAAAFGEIWYFKKNKNEISETWHMNPVLNFIDTLNKPFLTPCGSGNYLFTKAIWKRAGRYNESLGGALDSEIFGLCLLAIGAKFYTLKGFGYYHRYGYESSFIRDTNKLNDSLTIIAGIIRHIHLIDTNCVDYMLGSGRTNWRHNTVKRPIKGAVVVKQSNLKMKIKRRVFGILERL